MSSRRVGPPLTTARDIAKAALQPLAGGPFADKVLVVNEAFGTLECWAEGSLTMAENAAHRLGLPRPAWLPEAIYEQIMFDNEVDQSAEDDGHMYVSDLKINEAAAQVGAR